MAEFEVTRAQLDEAKDAFTQVYDASSSAYDAWWPSVVAGVLSLVQDPTSPEQSAAQLWWDEVGNPMDTVTRAILNTLRQWPDKLETAWQSYQDADAASAQALFQTDGD